jgi:hypothetical protein
MIRGSITSRGKISLSSSELSHPLWIPPASYSMCAGGSLLGDAAAGA